VGGLDKTRTQSGGAQRTVELTQLVGVRSAVVVLPSITGVGAELTIVARGQTGLTGDIVEASTLAGDVFSVTTGCAAYRAFIVGIIPEETFLT